MRALRLTHTAWRTLMQRGPLALIVGVIRWLRGERGYWRLLPPNAPTYDEFVRLTRATPDVLARQAADALRWPHPTRFVVVTEIIPNPSSATHPHLPLSMLERGPGGEVSTAAALLGQSYPYWRRIILAPSGVMLDAGPRAQVVHTLDEVISALGDADYVIPLAAGNRLSPDALYHLAEAAHSTDADVIYSDSDRLDGDMRHTPWLKPDWSPDLLLAVHYAAHGAAIKRDLWIETARETQAAAWTHAAALHACLSAEDVTRIPRILYHATSPARADAAAVQRQLERMGVREVEVRVVEGGKGLNHRDTEDTEKHRGDALDPRWMHTPKLSVVIPTRDQAALLRECVQSVLGADYPDLEVVLVDTGSIKPETAAYYASLADIRVRKIEHPGPFNFSAACNAGARSANGDALLFLNNDTRLLNRDGLRAMSQWLALPDVGAVGGKLLFPNGLIQHAGVVIGLGGPADNLWAFGAEGQDTPFGQDTWIRNVSAVTGACVMVRREAFYAVGGFDEGYTLAFSDAALGVALWLDGWRVVMTPHARWLHHEGATRRNAVPPGDRARFEADASNILRRGDPFFNPNLSPHSTVPVLNRYPPR